MTDPARKTTTDYGWEEHLLWALDVALLEQGPDTRFRTIGRPPGWFEDLLSNSTGDGLLDLADRCPFLELFLDDCRQSWEAGSPTPLCSDIWTELDNNGEEHYVQALATSAGGRRLLILRFLPKALFTYQQMAHDLELEKEKVERMSRELVELNRELELKRQEAERATRAKSDFLATMSHEIRTPLHAIIGMGDVLAGTSLTPEQWKCLEVSQRNSIGLLNLINEILDLSKVESGKIQLEEGDFDLRDVIAKALEVIEVRARAKGLALRWEIAPGVAHYLVGDSTRLQQVIINLLGNSIKFTEQGSLEVRVEADPEDPRPGCLRFAVSDTGIGIPQDRLGFIFESFTQADSSTTRKYGGTGLGLSISKQFVELMGGRIWVESELGRGSIFFFTVKLGLQADQSERESSPVAQAAAAEPQLSGLKILLADDAEDNRFLILSYLKEARCSIEIAENGEIAVQKFGGGHYDMVLMDVEMPVMDGYTATRNIRQIEQESGVPPTPILALTAHAFSEMDAKGREAGFTAHLTKPIRKATLLEAVTRHAPGLGKLALAAPGFIEPSPARSPKAERALASMAERIRVVVETGMEDIVPAYLDKRHADIPKYRQALMEEDFDTLRMLGHKLKGTGAGYGFEMLTTIGGLIEQAALKRDTAKLRSEVDALEQYLNRVELQFNR